MANRYSSTRINSTSVRFYDQAMTKLNTINIEESMTAEQKLYLGLNKAYSSNNKVATVLPAAPGISAEISFADLTFATPPAGFPALTKTDFHLFINGVLVETDAIDSITQNGANTKVVLNAGLNFEVETTDEFMITGKFA
jgi:hypothetical protein